MIDYKLTYWTKPGQQMERLLDEADTEQVCLDLVHDDLR